MNRPRIRKRSRLKTIALTGSATLLVAAGALWLSSLLISGPMQPLAAQTDGCYICQGQPYTFVKFEGKDNWDKRKKAEACGCKVGGTTSSCDAANYTILCEVR